MLDIMSKPLTLSKKPSRFTNLAPTTTSSAKDGEIVWQQDAIRALRKHMNMTQSQFAEELGGTSANHQRMGEWRLRPRPQHLKVPQADCQKPADFKEPEIESSESH